MDPRLPKPIQPILINYIKQTQEQLAGLIQALYIVGSIALGEFNERSSDVDFIAVFNRKATSAELKELDRIHQAMENQDPRWKMSGSYLQASGLGSANHEIEAHPHFHDGVFDAQGHGDLNRVTWWELKNCGIALIGPEPQTLSFEVDWNELIREMKENLNTYWKSWSTQPRRIVMLYSDWGIQWAVLGVLRQFYSFRENAITTKIRSGQYAVHHLPARWHPLIQEAIAIRQGQPRSYRLKWTRAIEAVHFLEYMIQLCNDSFPAS